MEKIKESPNAGTFYPAERKELKKLIKSFSENSKNYYEVSTRAVIVPHAALVHSGRIAYEGICQIDKSVENVFIIAPSHKVEFEGLALLASEKWKTPLGNVKINQEICLDMVEKFGADYNTEAFENEYSIEVLLPLIQTALKDANIVPILVGRERPDGIEKVIAEYYGDTSNAFVISSDLSHFLNNADSRKVDLITADMIETGNILHFRYEQACNAIAIAGLVQYVNRNKYSLIRIDMSNSSVTTGDANRVVGYGSWFLYEGSKNEFIEKYYSKYILNLVRTVIESAIDKTDVTINYAQILDEQGACFITLEQDDKLRGCIGSIIAHQPLINDIIEHSRNAAFNDRRFEPVTKEDLKNLKVSVSVLNPPRRIGFSTEADLLDKITPDKDGIIIKDGKHQALYLPSVWDEISDKKEFLDTLKMKAGFAPDYFSPTFEAYKFDTLSIKE